MLKDDNTEIDITTWLENGSIISSGPGKVLLAWGQREWTTSFNSTSISPCFYFPSFFLKSENAWFSQPYTVEVTIACLKEKLAPFVTRTTTNYSWNNPYFKQFSEFFSDLQEKIQKKKLAKAVPYVFENSQHPMSSQQLGYSLLELLAYIDKNPAYIYGFWDTGQGILGATPEILFQLDGCQITTMACAGTIGKDKGKNAHQLSLSLTQDPKELHEHQLVIQGIQEALKSHATVHIGKMQLLELPTLSHLMTPIGAEFHCPMNFEEIAHLLHPTPALGTFPRDAGLEWLHSYQAAIDRSRFGAPVGYFFPSQNQGLCYVAIRNVQWNQTGMRIGAGCGVVAESDCEKEWKEINLKLCAIKRMLAL